MSQSTRPKELEVAGTLTQSSAISVVGVVKPAFGPEPRSARSSGQNLVHVAGLLGDRLRRSEQDDLATEIVMLRHGRTPRRRRSGPCRSLAVQSRAVLDRLAAGAPCVELDEEGLDGILGTHRVARTGRMAFSAPTGAPAPQSVEFVQQATAALSLGLYLGAEAFHPGRRGVKLVDQCASQRDRFFQDGALVLARDLGRLVAMGAIVLPQLHQAVFRGEELLDLLEVHPHELLELDDAFKLREILGFVATLASQCAARGLQETQLLVVAQRSGRGRSE